MKLKTR